MTKRNKKFFTSSRVSDPNQKSVPHPIAGASRSNVVEAASTASDRKADWEAPRLERLGSVDDATLVGFGTNTLDP